jgi:hypothetical protein
MPYIGAPALRDHCPLQPLSAPESYSRSSQHPRGTRVSPATGRCVFELMRTAQGDEPDDRLRRFCDSPPISPERLKATPKRAFDKAAQSGQAATFN